MLRNGAMKSKDEKTPTSCNNQSNNYLKINGYKCEPPRLKQMIMNENLGLEISTKVYEVSSQGHLQFTIIAISL